MELLTTYGLKNILEASLESLLILSGLTLFFFKLYVLKNFNIYFFIYPIWTLLTSIGLLIKGTFGQMVVVLLLNPIWPDGLETRNGQIRIYDNAKGFMSMCCPYLVTEEHYLILEKEIGEFQITETFNPQNVTIQNFDDRLILSFSNKRDDKEKIEIKKHGS
tara:strand:+ start:128 stop:613 length:486 start_codon:yes stop_codon:yes gene_type:complete